MKKNDFFRSLLIRKSDNKIIKILQSSRCGAVVMTFKQLEALYWVATLGGFHQAARKLHTTQSTVSKRIQDLEGFLGVEMFDRNKRNSRLTEDGKTVLAQCKQVLEMRDNMVNQVGSPLTAVRTIRLGLTELTAITWMPKLIKLIGERFPNITIEPIVDMSKNLRLKLMNDDIDIMIVPDAYPDRTFTSHLLGRVRNVWMSKPGLINTSNPIKLEDLKSHKFLMNKSGAGRIYEKWFDNIGFTPNVSMFSNSIAALIALTVAGVGISYFPENCLKHMTSTGMLEKINVIPELPEMDYVAVYNTEKTNELLLSILELSKICCNYDDAFQI